MQSVLITGISRGIGRSLAEVFLNNGYKVVGTTLTGDADFSHEHLTVLELDLAKPESIAACVARVESLQVTFDIVINNAGVLLDEDEVVLVPELLRATLEVNLIGTADFAERVLPRISPKGHLIFISSTAGSLEYEGHLISHFPKHYPAYKISKTALNMYMRTLALRLKGSGPVVSSVHPGWVKTAMGGAEADLTPAEAAEYIYQFAITRPETGFFWFKGKTLPW